MSQLALSKNRYARTRFGTKPTSVTIDNERILSLALDGKIVSGTIDRLAILYRDGQPYAAEIIDFKTDAYDEDMVLLWLEDRVDHQPRSTGGVCRGSCSHLRNPTYQHQHGATDAKYGRLGRS